MNHILKPSFHQKNKEHCIKHMFLKTSKPAVIHQTQYMKKKNKNFVA